VYRYDRESGSVVLEADTAQRWRKGDIVGKEPWLLGAPNANEVVSQFYFTLFFEIEAFRLTLASIGCAARRSTTCFRVVVAHGGHFAIGCVISNNERGPSH